MSAARLAGAARTPVVYTGTLLVIEALEQARAPRASSAAQAASGRRELRRIILRQAPPSAGPFAPSLSARQGSRLGRLRAPGALARGV